MIRPFVAKFRRRYAGRAAMVAALLAIAGCSAPGAGLPPVTEVGRTEYRLGSGDTLRLLVFQDPRMSGEFRVNDNGTVAVPLIGSVPADGRTVREVESAISSELSRQGLLRNAQVSVEVINYRPFFILGEVERPGQYAFQPGMTVLTAVAIGGGFTYRAERDFASITRVVGGDATEGKAQRQSFVQPGDVITVFERRF